jgi:poly(A) polymerase
MDALYDQVTQMISPIYMVGGCVRDGLMGVTPKDYDFITPHRPEVIEQMVRQAGRRPFLAGKRFGTIGVKIGGHLVEITTFRTERYLRESRKPDVEFVDHIAADLGRRDFTINAIAKSGDDLIDPFNGLQDIKEKIIRCVGDPPSRFIEDPLRMLRAARFSGQLGFSIDPTIYEAARCLSHTILKVSKERWVAELDRLLLSPDVYRGVRDLMDTGVLRYIMPELSLQRDYRGGTVWEATLREVSSAQSDITLRWAALLSNMAHPFCPEEDALKAAMPDAVNSLGADLVIRLGTHLRWPKKRIDAVSGLVKAGGIMNGR